MNIFFICITCVIKKIFIEKKSIKLFFNCGGTIHSNLIFAPLQYRIDMHNPSKTCGSCPLIQSLWLCNIFILVLYLNKNLHRGQVSSRVKVILTHKQNIIASAAIVKVFAYLGFLLHMWNMIGDKKPCIDLGGEMWLPGCTSVLNTSSFLIGPILYKDIGW